MSDNSGTIRYDWNIDRRIFQELSDWMNICLIWLAFVLDYLKDCLVNFFLWCWSKIIAFISLDCFQTVTETGTSVWWVGLWSFFGAMALVWLMDQIVVQRIAKLTQQTGRYFLLHGMFNAWVVVMVIQDAGRALVYPESSILDPGFVNSTIITMAGIASFHVYHCLIFEGLTFEDRMHHMISAGLIPIVGMLCPFGRVASLSNLGMCGLPGGIDYFLLTGVKNKMISSMTEKRINRFLNLIIRWPIQLLSHYLIFRVWWLGHMTQLPEWQVATMIMGCFMHSFNAVYYADKVIGNYYVRDREWVMQCPVNPNIGKIEMIEDDDEDFD